MINEKLNEQNIFIKRPLQKQRCLFIKCHLIILLSLGAINESYADMVVYPNFLIKTGTTRHSMKANTYGLNLCSLATRQSSINFFISPKAIGVKFSLKIGRNK